MLTIPLWMRTVEAQMKAATFCSTFVERHSDGEFSMKDISSLNRYYSHVKSARPFGWSSGSIQSVTEASESIPQDTLLNSHNLSDTAVFWWFEQPLHIPFRGLSEVHALVGVWKRIKEQNTFFVTLWYQDELGQFTPGSFWSWQENKSLSEIIEKSVSTYAHSKTLGYSEEQLDQSLHAVTNVCKFILAAFAWLDQKILTVTEEHGERHARKRYQKVVKQWHPVSVVHLRKRVYQSDNPTSHQPHAAPSYRYVVHGHWRNQPCGPSHSDRKLIYIMPFIKGPEEAPFRPKVKVYEVTR